MNAERKAPAEELMTRYLLGELPEEERARLEEACFADEQYYEELLAVEAELTDDYVSGRLTAPQRERFEQRLLHTPGFREEIEFAKIINGPAAEVAQAPPSGAARRRSFGWKSLFAAPARRGLVPQAALATLALVVLGVGVWLFWSDRQTRLRQEQLAQEVRATEDARRGELPPPSPDPSTPTSQAAGERQGAENKAEDAGGLRADATTPTPPSRPDADTKPPAQTPSRGPVVFLALLPGFERDAGGANDLVIPRGARRVRLRLAFGGDDYRSYHAVLRSIGGKEIFNLKDLKARPAGPGRAVTLELPAGVFPAGDFILTLSGSASSGEIEIVNRYVLTVRKQ